MSNFAIAQNPQNITKTKKITFINSPLHKMMLVSLKIFQKVGLRIYFLFCHGLPHFCRRQDVWLCSSVGHYPHLPGGGERVGQNNEFRPISTYLGEKEKVSNAYLFLLFDSICNGFYCRTPTIIWYPMIIC